GAKAANELAWCQHPCASRQVKVSSGATPVPVNCMVWPNPSSLNGLMSTEQCTVTVTSVPAGTTPPGKPDTWAVTLPPVHQLVEPRSACAACRASWSAWPG